MDNPLLEEFSLEAAELLDESEDALLELDKGKDPQECYNLVFRCFHSLKGSAGMMGLDEMQKHMHLIEDRFQSYSDKLPELASTVDYFLMGIDVAREIMKGNKVEFDYRDGETLDDPNTGDKFDNVTTDLFKRLDTPTLVVGAGKVGAKVIIDALSDRDVLCVATANKLSAVKDLAKPITIIVKEEMLEDVKAYLGDKASEHGIIIWGEKAHPDHLTWNESMNAEALSIFINALGENKVLKFAYSKAVMLLLYQLSDIEDFLIEKNKSHILKTLKMEIKELMEVKAKLRK
jgi:HPt (histidine-containing phosphotransfer) domain-containing protein